MSINVGKDRGVEKIATTALRTLNFSALPGVDKPKYPVSPSDRRRNRMKNLIRKTSRKGQLTLQRHRGRAPQISAAGFATAMNYVRCLRASDELSL
jgi:hypothetical protein